MIKNPIVVIKGHIQTCTVNWVVTNCALINTFLNKNNFFSVTHLTTCIFLFSNEPGLGAAGIDPGMVLTPFPSSTLDERRFEPTTF